MPKDKQLPEPWLSFFGDFDHVIGEPVALHCFGGFVVIHAYGVARTTNDCDFVSVVPHALWARVSELGGRDSELHKRHKVYLDPVTVATPPDGYQDRLIPLFARLWRHLRLYALEAHDLALAKLERNFERDRDDIQRLVRTGHLDPDILRARYYEELRPYLPNVEWHDQTLRLWLESYWDLLG